MKNVYDNGEMLLGSVENVKKYLLENMEHYEEDDMEIKNMIEDLEDLGNDFIVMINYDFGMGYVLEHWHTEVDLVKETN